MQTTIHAAIAAMLVAAGYALPPALMAIETLAPAEAPARWADLTRAINATMRERHYDPSEFDTLACRGMEAEIEQLGRTSETREDFVRGFNAARRKGPIRICGSMQRSRA